MLDRYARTALDPVTDRVAGLLAPWMRPGTLTALGLVLGLAAASAAAGSRWLLALVLWLVSRAADGLDGPVARRRRGGATDLGGYLDIVADFTAYGAFVVGCALGNESARVALLVLLATYYVNGTAFLALSSIVERRGHRAELGDQRSVVFTTGLAEGTETIVAHSLLVAVPQAMAPIAWTFAAMVVVTVGQRVCLAARLLKVR